jgi:ketosteroid isomerase-like protein
VLVVLDADVTVRSTGTRIAFDEVHEFTVEDGRIVRYRPHLDTAAMRAAFGHHPRG